MMFSRVKEICARRTTARQGLVVIGGGGISRNVFLSFKKEWLNVCSVH